MRTSEGTRGALHLRQPWRSGLPSWSISACAKVRGCMGSFWGALFQLFALRAFKVCAIIILVRAESAECSESLRPGSSLTFRQSKCIWKSRAPAVQVLEQRLFCFAQVATNAQTHLGPPPASSVPSSLSSLTTACPFSILS